MSDTSGDGVDREPRIYGAFELPESEKGDPCPMYAGIDPLESRCDEPSEFVFVYEASFDPNDDRRKNCLCCPNCKPQPAGAETDQEGSR